MREDSISRVPSEVWVLCREFDCPYCDDGFCGMPLEEGILPTEVILECDAIYCGLAELREVNNGNR